MQAELNRGLLNNTRASVQVSTAEVKLTATRTEYQTLSQKFDDLLGRYTEYKNK
jgi:hypothetical protein|tara:strand:- start:429 stop:590 length:162 start_codon:yes stop_codon:yes gene_type:complete